MENIPKRDYAISYVRFVAMMMIITCHFFQYYGSELAFWFNVGVEIFFIISGFLYGAKEIEDPVRFIALQFKKILLPYFLFLLPVSVLYIVFARTSFSLMSFVKAVFCVGTIDGLGHLWFIGYILLCYFLTPYLFWVCKKTEQFSVPKTILLFISILLGIVVFGTLTKSYFQPNRICSYVIGFMLAVLHKKCSGSVMKGIKIGAVCLAAMLTGIRIYIKYLRALPKQTVYYRFFVFAEPYLHMLLGLGLFFVLYFVFSKARVSPIATLSDRYSFSIYIVHQTFILSPFSTMNITSIPPIDWIITITLILTFGVILRFLTGGCEKIFWSKSKQS